MQGAFYVAPGEQGKRLKVYGQPAPAKDEGRKRKIDWQRIKPAHSADAAAKLQYAHQKRAHPVQLKACPGGYKPHKHGEYAVRI